MPGLLKKPPPAAAGADVAAPGWVMVRFIGCAVPGAVVVEGGAEKVREPREPELEPPPTRASAAEIAITRGTANERTTAIAWKMPRVRWVKLICVSSVPVRGKAPLRWADLPKSEAIIGNPRCGPRSRGCDDFAHDPRGFPVWWDGDWLRLDDPRVPALSRDPYLLQIPCPTWVPSLQRIIAQTLHAAQRTGHDTAMTSHSRGALRPSLSIRLPLSN